MDSDERRNQEPEVVLTPAEYEAYVEELVRNLIPFKGLRIRRNQRFSGVRQPGDYEIDVAAEFSIEDKLDFRLIVECKNWRRPVGRDVIQKLAQTRDAIAAHKAIVCSPSGFTQEAIKVAKAHGIALWVIAARQRVSGPSHWHSSSARAATPTFHDRVEDRLRERLAQAWGVSLDTTGAPGMWRVKDIRAAWNDGTKKTIQNKAGKFITPFSTVSVFDEWLSDFLFDSIFRVAQKAEETRADIQRIRSECEEAERRKRDQDVQRFQRYFLQNRRADLEE